MAVGIAWYTREQWLKLQKVAADPEALDSNYDEWIRSASQGLDDLTAEGLNPEQVFIDVDELDRWCRDNRRPNDGSARAEFTAKKLRELDRFRKG